MVIGQVIRLMGMVFSNILMETSMRENGSRVRRRVLVSTPSILVLSTRATGRGTRNTAKAPSILEMATITQATGKTTNKMDKVSHFTFILAYFFRSIYLH